jgi:predicted enzyme related to lactoylglutathione lyase
MSPRQRTERIIEMARINYVELPAKNIAASSRFYAKAFGFALTDFGPTYAATLTGDVDLGLQGDASEATKAPLPVIDVDDLEAALAAVTKAGGKIVRPIFSFPGGRRFQFLDPNGNELAVTKGE